jgi:hypothetical protein
MRLQAVIRNSPPPQLLNEPQFQTDGKFDQTKYERWLASATGQQYVPLLEQQYRTQLLQAKLGAPHRGAALHVRRRALGSGSATRRNRFASGS